MSNMDQDKNKIFEICRRLHARNLLASADGNVSIRDDNDLVWITPTGVLKAFLKNEEQHLACLTLDGKILSGSPSGERLMHLEVYKKNPIARAVVHAHPPTAIAWSLAHPEATELPCEILPEILLAVGRIPIVPYARPSTLEMGTHLHPFITEFRVMILSKHGGLSWGESLDEAYGGMERLEHSCQILKLAFEMGKPQSLPASEVAFLRDMRKKMGGRTL